MKQIATVQILLSFGIFFSVNLSAAPEESMTFFADYTKSMDNINASVAKGSPVGKLSSENKAEFDFDTMSHSIRGISTGTGLPNPVYSIENNLPFPEGSIEMVVKKMPGGNVFFQTENGSLIICSFPESGITVSSWNNGTLNTSLKQKVDSWHHVVATYKSPECIVLYVDGEKAGQLPLKSALELAKYFSVGPYPLSSMCKAEKATVASISIYSKVLQENEIKLLAKDKLPDLSIKIDSKDLLAGKTVGAKSPWLEKRPRLGLEALDPRTVLPPWTPVTYQDGIVSIWGRHYSLDGKSLLDAVESAGKEILAMPVDIFANEKALAFSSPEVIAKENGLISISRKAEGPVPAELKYSFEYDGLIWMELSLKVPEDGLGKLKLSIPLRNENAEFIHYVGAPLTYESQDLVKNSFSRELGKEDGTLFKSGLKTNVWIGNNDCGLLYFMESDQYWWPKNRKNIVEVSRKNGTVFLDMNMITEKLPLAAGSEVTVRFGLMATPVKPMPEGWRGWTLSAQYDSFVGDTRGNHTIYWDNEWRFISLDPDPTHMQNPEYTKNKVRMDKSQGRKIFPYWSRLHMGIKQDDKVYPDADIVKEEWATSPNRPGGGNSQYFRASASSGWTDYLVWCVEEWAAKTGHLDGVYMDETQPIPNTRKKSGGGYDGMDGKRYPTYESFGSRNLIKRITWNTWKRNNELPTSMAHCSATHTMQSLGFYTMMLIGEQYYSGYFKNLNPEFLPPEGNQTEALYYYSYALPVDRLRAECYWKQWGSVMVFLPCLKNQKDIMKNPIPTRDMLSRLMQADILVWPLFCNAEEVYKTQRFRKDFGIADENVEFVPFWENTAIKADNKDVVIGYYRNEKDKKYLAIVSNFNRRAETVEISFPGLDVKSVKNAENQKLLPFENGKLKLDMKRNDYIALRINY